MTGYFWEGLKSLATSASDLTGSGSVNSAICGDDYGELLLDVGSVCTPDQGPQNLRPNKRKENVEITLNNKSRRMRSLCTPGRGVSELPVLVLCVLVG